MLCCVGQGVIKVDESRGKYPSGILSTARPEVRAVMLWLGWFESIARIAGKSTV